MARRGVGRGLGTSNIVPGMPGDHPASIRGVRGRPGAPQRQPNRNIIFCMKIRTWLALSAPTSKSGPGVWDLPEDRFQDRW